jgi:hypothetical protein
LQAIVDDLRDEITLEHPRIRRFRFITAEQAIINLLSHPGDLNHPEKVEFYYPLSPTKAMLYLEKSNPAHASDRSVSVDQAHAYNCLVVDHSGQQIFSNSEEYLRVIQRRAEAMLASVEQPPSVDASA